MPPACLGRCLAGPLKLLWRGSLPRVKGTFRAEDLEEPEAARIARDKGGVPHITAATEADLFFLNGVVHGQDRLWQLHTGRRLAAGRVSEFAGPRALELDRLARQLGFRRLAEGDLQALRRDRTPEAAQALRMLEAFARGVNWAVARARKLPIEFRLTGHRAWDPWEAVDTLSLCRLYGFVMNFGFQHTLVRQGLIDLFGPERAAAWTNTSEEEKTIPHTVSQAAWSAFREADLSGVFNRATEALPREQGSNWWVVHGSNTETGKPIVVGDPHLVVKIPNFWYEIQLVQAPSGSSGTEPQGLRAYGVAPPGVPGILIGQNGFAAWSITLAYCDVEDIFLERVRRSDGRYLYRDEWHECQVREERIEVKGAAPVLLSCRSTRHGALLEGGTLMQYDAFKQSAVKKAAEGLSDAKDEDVIPAYSGIALRPESLGVMSVMKLLRVRSFEDFDAGLAYISQTYSLNVGYADVEGHIGYVMVGEVPVRGKPGDELLPLLGWTGEHDWQGFVTHSELPKAFDPPDGIIISANHKVIDSKCYPHYLGQTWKSGYRAQAVRYELQQLLAGGQLLSPEQMPAVLMNVRSWAAVEFVEELRGVRPEEDTAAALELLTSWDGELRADSVPAALYQLTHAELALLLLQGGCQALDVPPSDAAWAGLDRAALGRIVGGEGFDPAAMLKIVNEFQGHLHLNVLRILRSARVEVVESSPGDGEGWWFEQRGSREARLEAGRRWWLDQAGGRDAAVNAALRAACARLRALAGRGWQMSSKAAWGRLHICHLAHPLTKSLGLPPGSPPFDAPSVESQGDTNTVAQSATKSTTDPSATSSNVSMRVVFNLADLEDPGTNRIVSPLGQSGQFHSPHYNDQTKLWASGAMRPIVTQEEAVRKAATATMVFRKAKRSSARRVGPA